MSNVVIEHIILIPLLIIVVIFAPLTAIHVVSSYTNTQREVIAQGAMNQLTSTIQQLYYSLIQESIRPCILNIRDPITRSIDSYRYNVTATTIDNVLTLSLFLYGLRIQTNKTIVLSPNSRWVDSQYSSLLPNSALNVEKMENGTILFRFL
jgi:hypothetical protein